MADGTAPLDLGDLADARPDRPRSRGHDDGLARLGLTDVQQGEIGGQAIDAKDAERC
jgi:hypothetical protein